LINPFDHHRAVSDFSVWAQKDCKTLFPDFSNNLHVDDNIVYQQKDHFVDYEGKTLLNLAGGPSSKTGWEDIQYDYLWSMNHFYKNPLFKTLKVDLAMIMAEPNISDPDFQKIMERDKTYIGFEIHDRWKNYKFQKYENFFCMHTKFYGKIGIGARMKLFAAHLGFDKIYFTGCDGPEAIFSGDHFFEPGKKTLPSVFQGKTLELVHYHWKIQYDFFWKYLKSIYPNTKFFNLGGGKLYHEKCR